MIIANVLYMFQSQRDVMIIANVLYMFQSQRDVMIIENVLYMFLIPKRCHDYSKCIVHVFNPEEMS